MNEYWAGVLTVPLVAVVVCFAVAIIVALWVLVKSLFDKFLVWKPQFNKRVFAYKVVTIKRAGSNQTDKFLGASFIETRNLGPEHEYQITFDGTSWATLGTKRLPGGGWFKSHQNDIDWDPETIEELDRDINY